MSLAHQTPQAARSMPSGTADASKSDETLSQRLRRWALGTAWALKPPRTRDAPWVLYLLARHYAGLGLMDGETPDPDRLYGSGLAGIAPDLDVDTLMRAYAKGFYPFAHVGPAKWWLPEERMVLFLEKFDMEKNLRRRLRNSHFDITFDRDFEGVMRGCAELRAGRVPLTWITPQFFTAYRALHEAGHAHSVEVWDKEGQLVGGAYGVAAGGVFFTESQFNSARDAAKVGFAVLNCHLQHWGFRVNDGKHYTGHLAGVGFELIPRERFAEVLAATPDNTAPAGRWQVDESLDVGNWDPTAGAGAIPRVAAAS